MSRPRFPLHDPNTAVPRFLARVVSLVWIILLFGLFVALVPEDHPWSAMDTLAGWTLFFVWIGLLFGWYNELWGGIIVIAFSLLFTVFSWLSAGHFSTNWLWSIPLLVIPGALWLYVGLRVRPPDYS